MSDYEQRAVAELMLRGMWMLLVKAECPRRHEWKQTALAHLESLSPRKGDPLRSRENDEFAG